MKQRTQGHSCLTFLVSVGDSLLVGRNLDEYIPVPGLVFVNPRNITKENIGWQDLKIARFRSRPRIQWVSKYGSITSNSFGREFPDGGMNEVGLYIGEMTLLGTVYPAGKGLPRMYRNQWIQYILDNCASVEQVLARLSEVIIDGNCQRHFFVADEGGQTASIEFLRGEAVIHTGESMPIKVMGNASYAAELERIKDYEGFGGQNPVDFSDKKGSLRFTQAATILHRYEGEPAQKPVDFAFAVLDQLDCGNNKWQVVYDIRQRRMYYRTSLSQNLRYVDFSSFDFSQEAMMLDIHHNGSGDVSGQFLPFNEAANQEHIAQMWAGINIGFPFNQLFKPVLVRRLSTHPQTFSQANEISDIHPELRQVAKFAPKITFSNKNLWLFNLLSRLAPAPKSSDDVVVENVFIPGQDNRIKIRLRIYKPKFANPTVPVLLWMHGGGYVMGRPEQDDFSCVEYARELGISVVSVDYRCAPKDPFPAALEDCYTALEWVVSNSQQLGIDHQRIAVGGASAGGGLAASLAQYAYDQGKIKPVFQLLVYPMLDDRTVLRTDIDDRRTITWNQKSNKFGWESYLGKKCGDEDMPEYSVPARRNNLSGLAEAWIGVGTADIFYDEDVAYAQRLSESGVPCEIYILRGGFHGFDVFNAQIPVVQDFRRSQTTALKKCFFGDGYHYRLNTP